jgi:arylsulfatase A-like enzyme
MTHLFYLQLIMGMHWGYCESNLSWTHNVHYRPDLEQGEYGGSAGPFRCGKTSTWEGGFRVPAIAWWPGKIQVGRTTKLAAGYDILPTFFKIAGAEVPSDRIMDGYDMTPILYYKKDVSFS